MSDTMIVRVALTPYPAPGLAFVRKIETCERYAGGSIVIPEQARDRVASCQYEIVRVGAPERCIDDDCERAHPIETFCSGLTPEIVRFHGCDLEPGDWVLCRKRSAAGTPDPEIFVVRQDAVLGRFVECG